MAVWAEPQASGVAERIDPSGLKILTSRPLVLSYSRTLEMALRPPKGNSQDTTMLPLGAMARSRGAQLRIFDQAPHEEMAISIEYLDGVFADARGAHTRRQEGATIGRECKPPREWDDLWRKLVPFWSTRWSLSGTRSTALSALRSSAAGPGLL